jgi:hypothetical protein
MYLTLWELLLFLPVGDWLSSYRQILLFCSGQAEQLLNIRYKDHVRGTKNDREKSALAKYPKI